MISVDFGSQITAILALSGISADFWPTDCGYFGPARPLRGILVDFGSRILAILATQGHCLGSWRFSFHGLRPFRPSWSTVLDLNQFHLTDCGHFGPAGAQSGMPADFSSRIAAILTQLGHCPGSRQISPHGLRPFWPSKATVCDLGGFRLTDCGHFEQVQCLGSRRISAHGWRPFWPSKGTVTYRVFGVALRVTNRYWFNIVLFVSTCSHARTNETRGKILGCNAIVK